MDVEKEEERVDQCFNIFTDPVSGHTGTREGEKDVSGIIFLQTHFILRILQGKRKRENVKRIDRV